MRKLILVLLLVTGVAPSWASVITTGDVDPGSAGRQPDLWVIQASDLHVGDEEFGTLNIDAGGVVSSIQGHIGFGADSAGEAMVTNEGSEWNNSNGLYVGYWGNGTLNIEDGGVVSTKSRLFIAAKRGSTGTATVTGEGSLLSYNGHLSAGDYGDGTLNIEAGGMVNTTQGSPVNQVRT